MAVEVSCEAMHEAPLPRRPVCQSPLSDSVRGRPSASRCACCHRSAPEGTIRADYTSGLSPSHHTAPRDTKVTRCWPWGNNVHQGCLVASAISQERKHSPLGTYPTATVPAPVKRMLAPGLSVHSIQLKCKNRIRETLEQSTSSWSLSLSLGPPMPDGLTLVTPRRRFVTPWSLLQPR